MKVFFIQTQSTGGSLVGHEPGQESHIELLIPESWEKCRDKTSALSKPEAL